VSKETIVEESPVGVPASGNAVAELPQAREMTGERRTDAVHPQVDV
jgi:hypothetical protein